MAAITALTEDFSTPANGAQITTGNSIFDSITGSASAQPTCTTSDALDASQPKACRFVLAAETRICRADLTAAGLLWLGAYIYVVTAPGANTAILNVYDGETTKIADVQLTTARELRLRDGNTERWLSAALTANTWHRIALKVDPGVGLRLRVYTGGALHGSNPSQDSADQTSTIGATVSNIRVGAISNATMEWRLTRLRGDDAAEPSGLPAVNIPPVADAGDDQTGLEPYATVTLDGSDSTDPDGTVATYTWSQTAGSPTVTLTGASTSPQRTFPAPATAGGTTLTFSLVVTDDDAADSAADTMLAAVLPHNHWVRRAGAWTATRLRLRRSGTWKDLR